MRQLSAYYFRAHMVTMVPRHLRDDMEWMADIGTNAVVVAVLEQDLHAAVENLALIGAEAERVGMSLYATPARWGSLVAGSPKVPSRFSSSNPDVWALDEQGAPRQFIGPVASVHHPLTLDFFRQSLRRLFDIAPVRGIIWDEPKALLEKDYSPAAKRALQGRDIENLNVHTDAQADFFEAMTAAALDMNPELDVSMFLPGQMSGYPVERCARIAGLASFGLDGRPWRQSDGGMSDGATVRPAVKFLCDHGPLFMRHARENGKQAFMLIENHALKDPDIDLMDQRLPEILALGAEHMAYYYYPRSVSSPERSMNVLRKHLRGAARDQMNPKTSN